MMFALVLELFYGDNKTILFNRIVGYRPFIYMPNLCPFPPSFAAHRWLSLSASGEPHPHNGMHRELYGELANHPIIRYEPCLIFAFTFRLIIGVNWYIVHWALSAGHIGTALSELIRTLLMLLIVRITPSILYCVITAAVV